MSSSHTPSTTSSIHDLPPWAQGLGKDFVNQTLGYYIWGPEGAPGDPSRAGYVKSYDELGGPYLQNTALDPVEAYAQQDALARAKAGSPLKQPTNQFYMDQMGGDAYNAARNNESYFLGGPIAGATREDLMSQLTGQTQYGAEQQIANRWGDLSGAADQFTYDALGQDAQMGRQAMQQEMFGNLANTARQSQLATLSDQDVARGTEVGSYAGALANQARQQQMATIGGQYLSPDTNPYLKANYDAAARAMADQYKYATAPSTEAMFANAGTFGGSANRQLKSMQEFDFGRNLSDLAAQMYGQNYQQERQTQAQASGAERQYAQQMLDAARNRQVQTAANERQGGLNLLEQSQQRQYGLADTTANRALQSAMQERNNWQQSMMQERQMESQMTDASLGRNVQLAGLLPSLMSSDYIDLDVRRQLGKERRDISDINRQVDYQNQMANFEWNQKVLERLGGALATAGGAGGVASSTLQQPSGPPWATYAALAPVALSAFGNYWGGGGR